MKKKGKIPFLYFIILPICLYFQPIFADKEIDIRGIEYKSYNEVGIVSVFEEVVFGSVSQDVYGLPFGPHDSLMKWRSNLKTKFWHSGINFTEHDINDVEKIFDLIEKFTDLKVKTLGEYEGDPNFAVYFVKSPTELLDIYDHMKVRFAESSFVKMMKNIILYHKDDVMIGRYCFFSTRNHPENGVVGANILIPKYGQYGRKCIYEQIFKVLGLRNDIDFSKAGFEEIKSNIFSTSHSDVEPTKFDLVLLKTLYSKELAVGMGREEALPIVRRLLQHEIGGAPRPGAPASR